LNIGFFVFHSTNLQIKNHNPNIASGFEQGAKTIEQTTKSAAVFSAAPPLSGQKFMFVPYVRKIIDDYSYFSKNLVRKIHSP
jgi:hypothetical protein